MTVSVVNSWANSYGQGTSFTSITSALQSCVVELNGTYSVGGGSGTPTAGNWLFCIASWTQFPSIAEVHVGVGDDIHEWWREYPASNASGNVRTSISYVPNIGTFGSDNVPQYVYVAPDMEVAAINVLIVEVSGLGPWDTAGAGYPVTNYAAAATSLTLSGGAPGASCFFIAAVGGDNTGASQAYAPSGWTALHTLSQSNGSNQLASNYLTSAYLASSSSAQSTSASASSTDLSGFMLAVYVTGTSPIPASQNPNWPRVVFEAGFGSGYNTPDSEVTWTDLSPRLWDWDETTGIQYQLGSIQATSLTVHLDDVDGYLIPSNTSSPYYPNVQPGTPLRIRAAIGTLGGATCNRWYVIQRNATQWEEEIDEVLRRYCPVSGTDLWAALSAIPPTFYRSEIYEDNPYAWWPCDDQLKTAGVLPTSLLNAAEGNTNVLDIVISPNGATPQGDYLADGTLTPLALVPPGVAIYAVGTQPGWMFGDPQGSAASLATGNPVTSAPGSAAWQASGQFGDTGSYGWFLSCNDSSFPALSGGITVECWFNYAFAAGAEGENLSESSYSPYTTQPYNTPLTIWEIATGSNPVCILQLDTSGHLNLITYNGATGTSHSIYTSSDLRSSSWHMATVTLTATTWQVWLDGGQNANVSGTATGMTSAWTWLILNGDLGAHGGSSAGTGLVHGGNVSLAHVAVYPYELPYYRILDHYWAAVTGFGQLPAPSAVQISWVNTPSAPPSGTGTYYAPDGTAGVSEAGTAYTGNAGVSMSAVVVATVGSVTSGPSAWVSSSTQNNDQAGSSGSQPSTAWVGWTGVAPSFNLYTSADVGNETEAAVVNGSGDSFNSGYGSSAVGLGVCQTSSGSGASAPASASAVGDTVGQRIERLMRAGRCVSPNRCIDPASLLVVAPGVNGTGTQVGESIQGLQQSDDGMLYVDNLNNLTYWQRPHLASQYSSPVWQIGPTAPARIPYYRQVRWVTDPQRIFNVITVQPLDPTGAALPLITPASASSVDASQIRYGAQPLPVSSYLQSAAEMQSQANWLFTVFGSPQRHAEEVKIDASAYPRAWELVFGINVGDIVQMEDWVIGGGGPVYTFRVTEIRRHFSQGYGQNPDTTASVTLILDYEPSSYWS